MVLNKHLEELGFFLQKNHCVFQKDYPIKYDTYFKTGGNVKFFLMPKSIDELKLVIGYLKNHNLFFKIIGFTSNLYLLDEVEYSIIISTKNLKKVSKIEKDFCVEAGYALSDLVRIAIIEEAQGFEGLEGIPASVGGALFMNAGAYGHSISDNLISVDCLNGKNEIMTLKKEECEYAYRKSIFKNKDFIILSAKFKFIKGDRLKIAKNMEIFHIARHSYQDFVYPNLGSMISIPINIYERILSKNKSYIFKYWLLKFIFKNPVIKFINRKRPNQAIFNRLLLQYLKNERKINLEYNLSIKSSNILIQDGTVSTKEILNYLFVMYELLDKEYHVENEIVFGPVVYSIDENFKETYKLIIEKLSY